MVMGITILDNICSHVFHMGLHIRMSVLFDVLLSCVAAPPSSSIKLNQVYQCVHNMHAHHLYI